jgi:hypothetical protein
MNTKKIVDNAWIQTRRGFDRNNDWIIVFRDCTPGELTVPIQLERRVLLVGDHRLLLPKIERAVLKGLRREMPETPYEEFANAARDRSRRGLR